MPSELTPDPAGEGLSRVQIEALIEAKKVLESLNYMECAHLIGTLLLGELLEP